MSVAAYDAAIRKLRSHGIEPDFRIPASGDLIAGLEARLGVVLPPSYRKMLSEFGILGFDAQDIYGLGLTGLDARNAPSVLATEDERRRGLITDQMIWIMSSGYGPIFVIDCAERREDGECPVYEVSTGGYKTGKARVAESFGDFLMAEVDLLLRGED